MISQKIYLVRHGQTDFNLQGIVQGSGVDASLNDRGHAQARAFHKMYHQLAFDRVYVSKLKRSKESVMGFINAGIPYEEHEALNEICWGTREGKKITPEEDNYYHWILKQWQEGRTDLPIEGGDSPDDVAKRQQAFIDLIKSRTEDRNILVCMHGRAMRILLCQLLNYPLKSMDMFEHENLGLYLVHYTGKQFIVDLYNNIDHLGNLSSRNKEEVVPIKNTGS